MDLSRYYEDICKIPMLKKQEEQALLEEYYKEGTSKERKREIRDRVINSNLRFVFKKAKKLSDGNLNLFEEYILAGNEGLIVGFDKFSPAVGVRFLSYVGWWVDQRILKAASKWRIVAIPIGKQQLIARIKKAQDKHETGLSIDELSERFPESSKKELSELSNTQYLTYYIEDISDEELIHDPVTETINQELEDDLLKEKIMALPGPYYDVLLLHYGLDDGEEKSITHICKKLKISKDTFKLLKSEALQILRKEYEGVRA